jgi:hypothetical protein
MRTSREPSPLQIVVDQTQLENAEYFNYLGIMTTDNARYTRKIKSRISMAKAALNKNKTLFFCKLDFNLTKNY